MYAIGEIVTLSAARGGWQGVISDNDISIGARQAYQVHSLVMTEAGDFNSVKVLEVDIASSQGVANYPAWQVGNIVTLYSRSGTITAINGDDITVEIDWPRPKLYYTQKRFHTVPKWRLYIENNG